MKKKRNKPNGLNRSYHFFKSDIFVIFLFENWLYTKNDQLLWKHFLWNSKLSSLGAYDSHSGLLSLEWEFDYAKAINKLHTDTISTNQVTWTQIS